MSNVKNIVDLPVDRLMPHPNNPRKDLGDLTELADSIKKNGIMQNLTVVESGNNEYTVIIGHRRCAAAKCAGIETVPCAIVEMSEKEQLATMLCENMQRTDLTIVEQAEGIQLMLDLGESVADVAEQTGLSESTVRRRKKLMELDKDELKAAEQRGATLADYAKLDELEPQDRTEALKYIGTNNFDWKFRGLKNKERRLEKLRKFETEVSEYATSVQADEICDRYKFVDSYSGENYDPKPEKPNDCDKVAYVYFFSNVNSDYPNIKIYKERQNIEQENEQAERQAALNIKRTEWQTQANNLTKIAYNLRMQFIMNLSMINNEQMEACVRTLLENTLYGGYIDHNFEKIEPLTGLIWDEDNDCYSNFYDETQGANLKVLTAKIAYISFEDCHNMGYITLYPYKNENIWKNNPKLNRIYNFLTMLGYVMSEEEKQLRDGMHWIFNEYPRE